MPTIRETDLPGVGHKFQIEVTSGDRMTVVIHDDGTREIYHFTRKEPDRVASVVRLTDVEARQLAGIVGGLTYAPKGAASTEVVLDDLLIEWYTIERGAACVGKTIQDLKIRTRSGASIVSLIEPDRVKRTNPGPETVLNEGATLIIAGDRKTNQALKRLLVNGPGDS